MEAEFDCGGSSSNNGNDTPSTWIQATLSGQSSFILLKTLLILHFRFYMPELEKQIQQFQKLYHILLDQYAPVLSRYSVSSISTANQPESKFDLNPQSHNVNSSDLATQPCAQHVGRETQFPDAKNVTEINQKSLEENCSLSDKHYKIFSFRSTPKPLRDDSSDSVVELSVKDIDSEVEKNISILSESGPKICDQNVLEHWVDFEKRVSTSEVILELAEDNKTHMDVLLKRYEEQNRMNRRLKENVEVLMKENQLLHDENMKLMSENKLLVSMIQDRVMEDKRSSKSCSSCYGLRMMKNGFTRLKSRIMGPMSSGNILFSPTPYLQSYQVSTVKSFSSFLP